MKKLRGWLFFFLVVGTCGLLFWGLSSDDAPIPAPPAVPGVDELWFGHLVWYDQPTMTPILLECRFTYTDSDFHNRYTSMYGKGEADSDRKSEPGVEFHPGLIGTRHHFRWASNGSGTGTIVMPKDQHVNPEGTIEEESPKFRTGRVWFTKVP